MQTHTHLHSELISLISLSESAVTLSCLGQTWSSLPVQILGNGGCQTLSGLALNKSPQDNHTTIINHCYRFSLSLPLSPSFSSDQLSTCHSHLASTLAPVVSSSWFSSPLPLPPSPLGAFEYISPDIQPLLNLTGPCFVSLTGP